MSAILKFVSIGVILFTVIGFATKRGGAAPYCHGASHNRPNWNVRPFQVTECEVDMLFDVDGKKLDLCVVGHDDEQRRVKFWNIPQQNGWVPHFNIHRLDIELRIARIPPSLFGKPKQNIFV